MACYRGVESGVSPTFKDMVMVGRWLLGKWRGSDGLGLVLRVLRGLLPLGWVSDVIV